jgi:hypothetical protein
MIMEKLHHGQYVHLDILPNGNLRMSLTQDGIDEERENRYKNAGDDDVLYDLYTDDSNMGGPHGNGGPYLTLDISEVDGGHMSQAPAVITSWRLNSVDEIDWIDLPYVNYLADEDAKIWYWNEYMIKSMLQEIKTNGYCELTLLQ